VCRDQGIVLAGKFNFPPDYVEIISGEFELKAHIKGEIVSISIMNYYAARGQFLPVIKPKVQLRFNKDRVKFKISKCFPFCTNWAIDMVWDFISSTISNIVQEAGNIFFEEDIGKSNNTITLCFF